MQTAQPGSQICRSLTATLPSPPFPTAGRYRCLASVPRTMYDIGDNLQIYARNIDLLYVEYLCRALSVNDDAQRDYQRMYSKGWKEAHICISHRGPRNGHLSHDAPGQKTKTNINFRLSLAKASVHLTSPSTHIAFQLPGNRQHLSNPRLNPTYT